MNGNHNDLELSLRVEIRQPYFGNNGLQIVENFTLKPTGFLQLCEILGQFHKLAEQIRQEREKTGGK